jgi:proliferating cell nuclear antigen
MPRKIFELKTVQTGVFKTLIEALKELLTDTVIEFDREGMKVITTDTAHVILVHLRLSASKFESYMCEKQKIAVGVNMMNMHKIIKAANSGDTLSMTMYEDEMCKLHITFENSEKNSRATYSLNLLDMDSSEIEIPPEHFPSVITLPSGDFQKICRDMHNIADKVEIRSIGNQLMFRCCGDFCNQETVLSDAANSPTNDIVQGLFNLKFLTLFTKCTNLCNTVELYLKNDYPLIVRYMVASLGEIKLCLAPQDEKDTD